MEKAKKQKIEAILFAILFGIVAIVVFVGVTIHNMTVGDRLNFTYDMEQVTEDMICSKKSERALNGYLKDQWLDDDRSMHRQFTCDQAGGLFTAIHFDIVKGDNRFQITSSYDSGEIKMYLVRSHDTIVAEIPAGEEFVIEDYTTPTEFFTQVNYEVRVVCSDVENLKIVLNQRFKG